MGDNAILELLIRAKDEATATLQGVGKQVDSVAQKAGDFSKTMKVAGGILTGVGVAGVAMMKDWVDNASEAQKVSSQLEAVLKSTGGVAGVTKDQVLSLADSLSKVTAFDDEAIMSGENMLLTFTKIGKDVFPEATQTMLDMSQALGQDLKSSSIQLGKALNDPIQGVTALRRVGVAFTDSQQEQIKKLVESGKLLEAQKFILKELQTEFGGSAKMAGQTFAGQMAILNTQIGNVKEALGARLLPVLSQFAGKLVTVIEKINNLDPKVFDIIVKVVAIGTAFSLIAGPILMFIGFLPMISAGIGILSGVLLPAIGVIIALVAIVTAVYLAFKNWSQISTFLVGVWNSIKAFVVGILTDIGSFLSNLFDSIGQFFANIWIAITNFFAPVVAFVTAYLNALFAVWSYIFNTIFTLVSFIFQAIWAGIQIVFWSIYNFIAGILNGLWAIFGDKLTAIWNFIVETFNNVKTFITDTLNAVFETVGSVLGKIWSAFSEKFTAVSGTVHSIVSEVFDWFGKQLDTVWDKVTDVTGKIWQKFKEMASGIMDALKQIKFPHLSIGSGTVNVGGKDISYPKLNVDWYEQGGWVKNTGLAVVHQGEFVLSKDMLRGNTPVPANVYNSQQPITINAVINTPVDFDMLSYKIAYQLRNS